MQEYSCDCLIKHGGRKCRSQKGENHQLELMQRGRDEVGVGGVLSQALEVDAILLQVARYIFTRQAVHVHHVQDCLGHCIVQALHKGYRPLDLQQAIILAVAELLSTSSLQDENRHA